MFGCTLYKINRKVASLKKKYASVHIKDKKPIIMDCSGKWDYRTCVDHCKNSHAAF